MLFGSFKNLFYEFNHKYSKDLNMELFGCASVRNYICKLSHYVCVKKPSRFFADLPIYAIYFGLIGFRIQFANIYLFIAFSYLDDLVSNLN